MASNGRARANLREHIARILHDANTGSIVPDPEDPTKYGAMADALLDAGFLPGREWQYGFGLRSWLQNDRPYATEVRSLEEAQSLTAIPGDEDYVISRRQIAGPWELFEDQHTATAKE